MIDSQGVSYLIFGRDNGDLFLSTVREVQSYLKGCDKNQYEIIIVDDGSKDKTYQNKISPADNIIIKNLNYSSGIANAVIEGAKISKFDWVLPIPGHDMYTVQAIHNVVSLKGYGRIIIGSRNNLASERPVVKKLASRVLRNFFRLFIAYYIGDVHGLSLFRRSDIIEFLRVQDGHGHAIRLIASIIRQEEGLIIQTIAPIKLGHKRVRSKNLRNNFPSLKNVFEVIKVLANIRRN